jgi:aminoglycoside 6'-N-acetyltransferase
MIGHGSAFIGHFVKDRVRRTVTDPDPANLRAIRAYEKAGFARDRVVKTPDGPALLMVHDPLD